MAEQTITKDDGTVITERRPEPKPRLDIPCQAIVQTQIVICEPMDDGTWRLVASHTDNYNIVLDTRQPDDANREVVARIQEIKDQWGQDRIIGLENLLTAGRPSQTAESSTS